MKVLVADDHQIVRKGLVALLKSEGDFDKVYEADGGQAAIKMAAELKPDVVVMDLHMPDMLGTEATKTILAKNSKIRVIALTTDSDKRFIKQAFQAGAMGYLLKDCALEELVQAIQTVSTGKRYLSATVSNLIIDGYADESSGKIDAVKSPLTPRET